MPLLLPSWIASLFTVATSRSSTLRLRLAEVISNINSTVLFSCVGNLYLEASPLSAFELSVLS